MKQVQRNRAPFFAQSAVGITKKTVVGSRCIPRLATDHDVVRMDDVAFSFVMLYNSMISREKAFSFRFTSLSKFLAGSPRHAVKNDACSVLGHLAILVDDSGCVPRVVDHLPGGFVALGKETLGMGGVLCTGLEASGLKEIE